MAAVNYFGLFLSILFGLLHCICCDPPKLCTNSIPPEMASHTYRYALGTSHNGTWKAELNSQNHHDDHLTPTEESEWNRLQPPNRSNLENEKISSAEEEFKWTMLYRRMRYNMETNTPNNNFLLEVPLHNVRLDLNSLHGTAQNTNLEYLMLLDVDNLVWSFRKTAGLPTPGTPYGGWEAPNVELRGHFVGHYMSSSAMTWAATQNEAIREKMTAVVSGLYECQKAMGTGYLSAFPSEEFDRFEMLKPVWAPYYTIHKIMAGLLDQYTFAGNAQALSMIVWMADYFYTRVQNVIRKYTIERHWDSLNEEVGGMNDVLYRLYTHSGDQKHLELAHLFDKPCFIGLLAVQADDIADLHANTHIPIVVGAQMRYEVVGDSLYKVARNLFRWTKDMVYADYYERALTNGVLSIQRGTEPGMMIYMLPQAPGVSKAHTYHGWGTKYDSFWCCYGTATESFAKLGDSIYFLEKGASPSLYIIQFIDSTLTWDETGFALKQLVQQPSSMDPYLQVSVEFSALKDAMESEESTVNIRIPFWTTGSARAMLNSEELSLPYPGNVLTITRKWTSGDKVSLSLPVSLITEKIKDDRPEYESIQAILFGPYLLAAMSHGEWDLNLENPSSLSDWIVAVPTSYASQLYTLGQERKISNMHASQNSTLIFTYNNALRQIIMNPFPMLGTDEAAHGTFRIVDTANPERISNSIMDFVGKTVYLEPFPQPGMFIAHQGINNNVTASHKVEDSLSNKDSTSIFKVHLGLDKSKNSLSFESVDHPSCFLYGGTSYQVQQAVQLKCIPKRGSSEFYHAVSFNVNSGMSTYHPMSFIATGSNRNYLLSPLLAFKDERYSVYLNITS
ncbi:uncharacterized protein LOC131061689 isoform X2 [Cryptomeria japonica]|uniref:uncharacterized protein LOC131061689 isoform X2 n=1 Tax=Cryptomeria japonica TaxID=3369 RepID=UPI0027DA2C80|nr:uncharacterized protein LOC131061689 isoform X2 [Cryptomeria japonica]